jgi:hypothetical protein
MVLKEALDYTFYLKNGEHSLKKVIKICPWRIQFVVESATKSSDDYLNLLHIYPIQFRNSTCSFEMDRFSAKSTCIFPERKAWENSKGKRVKYILLGSKQLHPK